MQEIEIFVQGEGIAAVVLLRVASSGTVQTIVEAAKAHGLRLGHDGRVLVFKEDGDVEIDCNSAIESAGIGHRSRVHVHSCKKVKTTVNFNADSASHEFPPSTTVAKVKRWADDKFKLAAGDATEHVLQLCGSKSRPDEDVHLGTLAEGCKVCFDLVPKKRVEG